MNADDLHSRRIHVEQEQAQAALDQRWPDCGDELEWFGPDDANDQGERA